MSNFVVENFDKIIQDTVGSDLPQARNGHELAPLFPSNIVICGTSGSGKSNVMLNILTKMLIFDKLYVFCKQPSEDKYRFIKKLFGPRYQILKRDDRMDDNDFPDESDKEDLTDDIEKENECNLFFSRDIRAIPNCRSFKKKLQHVIIIDDMINEKNQKEASDLFIGGRKRNCMILYLTQLFYKVPKVVRGNSQYFLFFGNDDARQISNFAQTFCTSVTREQFMQLFKKATNKRFNFILCDFKTDVPQLRYRKNFTGMNVKEENKEKLKELMKK